MRSFLRKGFAATVMPRSTVVKHRPVADPERTRRWLNALTNRATTNESRNLAGQLSSLVNFYNRPSSGESVPEIDWNHWKETLRTEGLVDKVKNNYEGLVKEQYEVDAIATKVLNDDSEPLVALTYEMQYHGLVWLNNYSDYVGFLFELEEYGNPNDYLMHENYDFFHGLEAELEELVETHNYYPGAKDDLNLRGYYVAQFAWGKKVITYYRHPADDFKATRATKNILGR
eukprot:TRINITY_DN2380_c0_g1_i1.p1 TRINITY_DN2380_c0_g1~~TRINITY_DN2380_c0_g1_i1.p1  ORF type:complete len:230 (+),score=59.25 TRINITY_DN2380_c0_g1_i1:136-825(+)